ncbi:MAG: malate dehydrogenase [Elusimicrobia bacterium]|nr:malate dehydrogenase [Elusimicrobiota bacterium]
MLRGHLSELHDFARLSREDLAATNAGIVKDVVQQVTRYSPQSILLVVSNPLDAMCWVAYRVSGFPKQRVVGMAGILDTARMRSFVSEALGVSAADVQALVLGSHGDSMVPLLRHCTVGGIPLTQLLSPAKLEAIIQRTRDGGAEVVKFLKSGSAYYAPSAAILEMVESLLLDRKRVLPCAAYLEGEYGLRGIFLGVPVVLGAGGIERIVEVECATEERTALQTSAAQVQAVIQQLKSYAVSD